MPHPFPLLTGVLALSLVVPSPRTPSTCSRPEVVQVKRAINRGLSPFVSLEAAGNNKIEADKIRLALEAGRVEKWLVRTDPFGGVTVGLLDKKGYLIPNPVSKVSGVLK